eukprot:maker-scaffold_14-snap-gene-3.19-mRNA-1 protein AED:0.24 eAED:0.24 QI:197/1/0.5/1/1/1/2/0/1130
MFPAIYLKSLTSSTYNKYEKNFISSLIESKRYVTLSTLVNYFKEGKVKSFSFSENEVYSFASEWDFELFQTLLHLDAHNIISVESIILCSSHLSFSEAKFCFLQDVTCPKSVLSSFILFLLLFESENSSALKLLFERDVSMQMKNGINLELIFILSQQNSLCTTNKNLEYLLQKPNFFKPATGEQVASSTISISSLDLENELSDQNGNILENLLPFSTDILENIYLFLNQRNIQKLGRFVDGKTKKIRVPGLRLKLFSHQVQVITYMLEQKEQNDKVLEMFLKIPETLTNSLSKDKVFFNVCSREFGNREDLSWKKFGGIVADEPGLGKTISVLAFIIFDYFEENLDLEETISVSNELQQSNALAFLVSKWSRLRESERNSLSHSFILKMKTRFFQECIVEPQDTSESTVKLHVRYFKELFAWLYRNAAHVYGELLRDGNFENFTKTFQTKSQEFMFDLAYENEETSSIESLEVLFTMVNSLTELLVKIVSTYAEKLFLLGSARYSPSKLSVLRLIRRQVKDTRATLIIVPTTLVNHWVEQIRMHIKEEYVLGDSLKSCLVVVDGKSEPALEECLIVLIGKEVLSRMDVEENIIFRYKFSKVFLDEGHLGIQSNLKQRQSMFYSKSAYETNLKFLLQHARRFWVLTGTPAKQERSKTKETVKSLLTMLNYCSEFQLSKCDLASAITKLSPLLQSFYLVSLLSRYMIRKNKLLVKEMPDLLCNSIGLEANERDLKNYNALASFAKMNVILTTVVSSVSDAVAKGYSASLLNKKNSKYASTIMTNIRTVCCGFAEGVTTLSLKNREEFFDLVENHAKQHDVELDQGISIAERFVRRVLGFVETLCSVTECPVKATVLPIITPCFHFVCIDCFAKVLAAKYSRDDGKYWCHCPCPDCDVVFRVGTVSYFQPGFELSQCESKVGIKNTKTSYIIQSLRRGLKDQGMEKVIIFSQFNQPLIGLENILVQEFGVDAIAAYLGGRKHRELELKKFMSNPKCFVLLISKTGSTGLDLSIAKRLILLDKVWDESLENQIISRSWRLGVTSRASYLTKRRQEESRYLKNIDTNKVVVEQLYLKNTIEELMFEEDELEDEDSSRSEKNSRVAQLFKNLTLCPRTEQVETSSESSKKKVRFS